MGKNMKKNIYVCITESLCCTAEMNTISSQLYFSKVYLKKKKQEIWAQGTVDEPWGHYAK